MKLCPQCDFIYEDEQTHCDMDGRELVYDPGPIAFEGSPFTTWTQQQEMASTVVPDSPVVSEAVAEPTLPESRPQRRPELTRFALVAAAVLLGVLVFVVYHVSLRQRTSKPITQDSKGIPSALSNTTETPAASDAAAKNVSEATTNGSQAITAESTPERRSPIVKTPSTLPGSAPAASHSPTAKVGGQKSTPENISAHKDPGAGKRETAGAQNQPSAAKPEDPKKDSKVSSFFKKTGRILKKPFKF